MTKDAVRSEYICAVTPQHVEFIGPFPDAATAGAWGWENLENPCWNTVSLFAYEVNRPLELRDPSD